MKAVITTLLCFTLLLGCRRDTVAPPVDPIAGVLLDTVNTANLITVGNPVNMLVDTTDVVVYVHPPTGGIAYGYLDVDNDGTDDLRFRVHASYSLGAGASSITSVRCLHNGVLVRSFLVNDTVFFHADTLGNTIHRYETCSRIDGTDTVMSVLLDEAKITVLDSLSDLDIADEFHLDSIPFYRTSYTSVPAGGNPPYSQQTTFDRDCYLFPLNTERYIGFRVDDQNGGMRVGWIKLIHMNLSHIRIMEVAIQQ